MKLPAYTIQSRHGIYYYRIQYLENGLRKERRFSLGTKSPRLAKLKSVQISAIIAQYRTGCSTMAFNPNDPNSFNDLLNRLESSGSKPKFDVLLPNGMEIKNINTPSDVDGVYQLLTKMNLSTVSPAKITPRAPAHIPPPQPEAGGMTLKEMIQRFSTRKRDKLKEKTLYEYRNNLDNFAEWVKNRKNTPHYPIRQLGRQDIGDYIDDLKHKGISDRTIQNKYLAALGGLFEVAISSGAYPEGSNPARGHKVFTKKDEKKCRAETAYQPFSTDELTSIFSPENLKARPKPDDYWLPLLGLYTGGRIEELCQLAITDIVCVDGIWAISINDEDYKSVKTDASKRNVPIHPTLIELGFLDYVEDAKGFGTMLFPYLTADRFGKFSNTPSERFGKYLDTLNISDSQKVFHSFRKTSNSLLKEKGVSEEVRCQYVGHEYETTNSSDYGQRFTLKSLTEWVHPHLQYLCITPDSLTHPKHHFLPELTRLCEIKASAVARKPLVAERNKALAKNKKG
ncbi:tyrosine-type recombinase/integrase [Ferriphaselus sp. R-1]|uniref:tyrosine-type recombinase/integrase n=1 Tax=Ferriphaselus sp. R-1 TaxID=1485544 RepID=UPI000557D761|nr:tyrosine-type recombinase/integrase [Ferriphaselus sp. R-1]